MRAAPRTLARRVRNRLGRLRPVLVWPAGRDAVRVLRLPRWPRRYRLDDPAARYALRAGSLRLRLPDAAALLQLAGSGLLTGQLRRLRVRLASAPEWQVREVRPPRLARYADRFRWRRRRTGLTIQIGWSRPYLVERGLADAAAAVVRARPWDQVSGSVYALDRTAWLAGAATWPQGILAAAPPDLPPDQLGRPLGPYQAPDPPAGDLPPPVFTTLANPYGRTLVGAATPYRLSPGPDRVTLLDETGRPVLRFGPDTSPSATVNRGGFSKYAVVSVDARLAGGRQAAGAVRALAACGAVFAAPEPAIRAELDALGAVTVSHAKEVDDLRGYTLSVQAARKLAIAGDPALRRSALAGDGAVPLPAVSVVLSSMRADHIDHCLSYLAQQTYPALEVLLGLHGYEVPEQTRRRWHDLLPCPLRVTTFPAELTFGAVLGRLSRMADGELVTKLDDDDRYGRQHVTDLVLAWHTSGADLVAKGARFVHFPDRDETIDRAWAAPELFNVTPAGGTMLLSRGTLQQAGGWSHSSKHVDEDLLIRLKSAGGLVYRTHALEYVYVRRTTGHTFVTDLDGLVAQAERVYPGLPPEILGVDGSPTPGT